jgi:uncharacterized protein HemY
LSLGDLYISKELWLEAITALEEYLKKFKYSVDAMKRLEICYEKVKLKNEAEMMRQKIRKLSF